MSETIPDGKTCVLLVEGSDEIQFFIRFCTELSVLESIHIIEYRGATKENLVDALSILPLEPNFSGLKHIGIVRDADFTGGAFDSIVEAIRSANEEVQKAGNTMQLPVPQKPFEPIGDNLKLSVLILPNENDTGMLETVIIEALRDIQETESDIMPCVDAYFECLTQAGIETKPEPLPKATMRVYMAALYQSQMRTYIEGRNVDVDARGKDRKRSYLSDIYDMKWWSWEKEAFTRIREYLLQMIDDESE